MRIAVGHLYHESNTFCLDPTLQADFEHIIGKEMLKILPGVDVLQEAGAEIVPTIFAQRWSSGTVDRDAFLHFEKEILDILEREKDSLDGIYLSLHGGMTVAEIGSGEHRLLKDIRDLIGYRIPISVSMDMHANQQPGIEKLANIMTGYHTAPHIDAEETQRKAAAALVRLLRSGEQTWPAMVKLPMLLVGERALSKDEPLRTIYAHCKELEKDPRFLAATLYVGMAWSDTPNTNSSVVVTPSSEAYLPDAQTEAEKMADLLFEHRNECPYAHPTYLPEEAVGRSLTSVNSPLYLSDSGDNPTAGGVGDSTVLLRMFAETRTEKKVLFAPILDAAAYEKASVYDAGEEIVLPLGSNRNEDCKPLEARYQIIRRGVIRAIHGTVEQEVASYVLLRYHTLDVVLVDKQMAFTGMECFDSADIRIADYDIVVLKMGYMFTEISAPCRENMMAFTPGCTPLMITSGQYRHLPRPIWPLDEGVEWHAGK